MGQNGTCSTTDPLPLRTTLQRNVTPDIRKRMHPLHYIPPKVYNYDEPSVMVHTDSKIKVTAEKEEKENIEEFSGPGGRDSGTLSEPEPQQELIYKKIEVKWNKFIKMKRKSFMIDYDVIREIGSGGFGCVYKVVMRNGHIFRAAKKINKKVLKVEEHQNLLAEMAIMMHMDHPNITRLYEVYD